MADEKKIVTQDIFEKAIEDMLQYLSDNCLYEFVPYSDESIAELFNLTPEEAQRLSDLISDEVVSKYKLWSSSKINESLISAKSECNDYTDKMLTNISSISIKYVDTLPTSDISTSTIYILKNTGGGNDTLNLYDDTDSSWTVIGDFTISLDDYYKKSEMDTKLNDKANKTEVLLQDDVIVNKALATNSNVLTAKVVVDELDLKANDDEVVKKTDITTTIDSTSTNDKVVGAKALHDSLANKLDKTVILTTADEVNSFDREYQSFIIEPSVADAVGLPKAPESTWFCINLSHFKGFKYPSQIAFEYAGIERIMYRTAHNGVWHNWRKLCTTSVADIPKTIISWSDETYFKSDDVISTGNYYLVRNGICFVNIDILCVTPKSNGYTLPITLPKPTVDYVHVNIASLPDTAHGHSSITVAVGTAGTHIVAYGGIANSRYLGQFSYPVAES